MTDVASAVVVGGGPAGSATALALRRRGAPRVVLLEATRFDGPRIGESIPPDTRPLLAALGLWESFAAEGHDPCLGSCSSWGSEELGYNDFLFNPYGSGWHLDRRRFDPWLARAAEAAGVEVRTGARVEEIERLAGGGFRLRLAGDGEALEARFVVDATGRPARVARRLGASRLLHDRLVFMYGFFPSSAGARSLTLLEATPYGWWYAARLPGGRLVVAVAADPELVLDEGLHRRDTWLARLAATRHVAALLEAGAAPEAPLITCDAPSARLDRAAGPDGWLAVGDAASSFDPLSSQGIHKALADGLRAAGAAAAWLGGDPGALDVYAAAIAGRFDDYLRQRAYFYAAEQRWPDAPFGARRRSRAGLLSPPLSNEQGRL